LSLRDRVKALERALRYDKPPPPFTLEMFDSKAEADVAREKWLAIFPHGHFIAVIPHEDDEGPLDQSTGVDSSTDIGDQCWSRSRAVGP
jgi:hypothetical protein